MSILLEFDFVWFFPAYSHILWVYVQFDRIGPILFQNAVGIVIKGNKLSFSSWIDAASHGVFLCIMFFAHQSFQGI